jgi:hypothetical protein
MESIVSNTLRDEFEDDSQECVNVKPGKHKVDKKPDSEHKVKKRAPRSLQGHESIEVWEAWIQQYMEYNPTYLPFHAHLFSTYKASNPYPYSVNVSDAMLLNNWKYLTYEWLTGKKHRFLSLL